MHSYIGYPALIRIDPLVLSTFREGWALIRVTLFLVLEVAESSLSILLNLSVFLLLSSKVLFASPSRLFFYSFGASLPSI